MKLDLQGDGWALFIDTDELDVSLSDINEPAPGVSPGDHAEGKDLLKDPHDEAMRQAVKKEVEEAELCEVNIICDEDQPNVAIGYMGLTGGGSDAVCKPCKKAIEEGPPDE